MTAVPSGGKFIWIVYVMCVFVLTIRVLLSRERWIYPENELAWLRQAWTWAILMYFDVFCCFERFLAICYQGHICMICCPVRSRPITAIIFCWILVKSVKIGVLGPFWTWWKSWKHCFWPFFRCFERFLAICYQGHICMICCPVRSKPITAIISCSMFVKLVNIGVLGPFWT